MRKYRCANPKSVTITVSDKGYILMPNVVRKKMAEHLKYADLKFQDSAKGRASCIIQRAATTLTMKVVCM